MMTLGCRRLIAVGAAVLALLAAAPPRLAVASGTAGRGLVPVLADAADGGAAPGAGGRRLVRGDAAAAALPATLSRRVGPTDVAGTYSILLDRSNHDGCPDVVKLGRPEQVPGAASYSMLRYSGNGIELDGTTCSAGGLTVIRAFSLHATGFMEQHGLAGTINRFNGSFYERALLEWADSAGIGMDSWTCGDIHRWDNTTVMLFGDAPLWLSFNDDDETRNVDLEEGRPHILILNSGSIVCILEAPKPSTGTATPKDGSSAPASGSGQGGGLSAGPVAGVALGAAASAVAVAVAVTLGYRRLTKKQSPCNNGGRGGDEGGVGDRGDGSVGGGGGTPRVGDPAGTSTGQPWSPFPPSFWAASAVGGRPAPGGATPLPCPARPVPGWNGAPAAACGGAPSAAFPDLQPGMPSRLLYT